MAPSIAWHDSRGGAQAERMAAELGPEQVAERTGLPPRPLCSLVKYRWLREEHEPAARGVRWMSVAEWIVHRLGGEQVAELSLASRTGWLDIHARDWWPEALAWSGAPPGLLCDPAPATTPAGSAGDVLPRCRGAVLAVGGHDHLSAAVGAGATGEGDVLVSWGTAQAFIRAVAPLEPARVRAAVADGINVGWHAVDGRQCLLGATRSGAALQRVLDLLGVGQDGRAELERAALDAPATAGGIELHGLYDDHVALTGIGDGVSPALAWRAALESTGRVSGEILENMTRLAGPQGRLLLAGGWAEGPAAQAVTEAHLGAVRALGRRLHGRARGVRRWSGGRPGRRGVLGVARDTRLRRCNGRYARSSDVGGPPDAAR